MAPVLDLLPIYLLFETGVGGEVMKYRGVHLGLNAGDGYQSTCKHVPVKNPDGLFTLFQTNHATLVCH